MEILSYLLVGLSGFVLLVLYRLFFRLEIGSVPAILLHGLTLAALDMGVARILERDVFLFLPRPASPVVSLVLVIALWVGAAALAHWFYRRNQMKQS